MKIFYSASTNGFFTERAKNLPDDVVEITALQHQQLLAAQQSGKKITADANGQPIAEDQIFNENNSKRYYSSLKFLDRFTPQEQLAIVQATLSDAQIKLWYDRLIAANYIDLNDPLTIAGLDAAVAAGLLTANRKDAILGGE